MKTLLTDVYKLKKKVALKCLNEMLHVAHEDFMILAIVVLLEFQQCRKTRKVLQDQFHSK